MTVDLDKLVALVRAALVLPLGVERAHALLDISDALPPEDLLALIERLRVAEGARRSP